MKKTLTLLAVLALCGSTQAAELKLLTFGSGIPGYDEPMLMGMGMSADGKYVCGMIDFGAGYFVGEPATGEYLFEYTEDPEGAELRHINNEGVAIGFNGPGVTFNMNGIETVLECPEEYKYILGEDLTSDGSVMVGSMVGAGYVTYPAYCVNGGEWKLLPMFDDNSNLGNYDGVEGSAKYISGDGKIIVGELGSFGPAMLWRLNDDGEYVPDAFCTKYVDMSREDDNQFLGFMPLGLSKSGKYVMIQGYEKNDRGIPVPVIYDTETEEITVYNEEQDIDFEGIGLTPSAICDDGTFVGMLGTPTQNYGAFIMKAGSTQAEMFQDAFPQYAEFFATLDLTGYHTVGAMSADGRYIMGYGYYSEDLYDYDVPAYFQTYIIDTDPLSSVSDIAGEAVNAVPVDYYSIDGRRQARAIKGINIVRMSDGSVRKVVK